MHRLPICIYEYLVAHNFIYLEALFVGSEGEILPKVSSYISQFIPFISKHVLNEVGRINLGSGIF
ncbi:unnamed protein product, partial [marine sediment metagenome]